MKSRKRKVSNFKIGFYIRVSTEEQAQNLEGSIRNQEERLRSFVDRRNESENFGSLVEVFIDRAKSGKDTKRPGLQRLLCAIRDGEVDLVMASELSRISRSIKDFSDIWDLMQTSGCGFLSLRENFDSTNAAAEMMLFNMANMAQFERRQVSERVSANMNARAKRGLYNGGSVPYGYQLIKGKPGYLEPDPEQALVVQKAFEVYLAKGSLQPTARWLNDHGFRLKKNVAGGGRNMRLGHFTIDNLHHILRNKMYIGIRFYEEYGEKKEAKAVWKGLVDKRTFQRVQKLLSKNKGKLKPQSFKKHPYLVSGIVFCETCGKALSGKSAHGKTKKIPYYEHSWQTKRGASFSKNILKCENRTRFSATMLEKLVQAKVLELMTKPEISRDLWLKAKAVHESSSEKREELDHKAKIQGFASQLDALAKRLSELPKSVSAQPIYKQMEKVEGLKTEEEEALAKLRADGTSSRQPPIALKSYDGFLESLRGLMLGDSHEVKSKILKRLIHQIDLGSDKVTLHFKMNSSSLVGEPLDLGPELKWNGKLGIVEKLAGDPSGEPQEDGRNGKKGANDCGIGKCRGEGVKKGDSSVASLSQPVYSAERQGSHTLTFGAPGQT